MTTVSVVIPAYNRAHTIGATLSSVLLQTHRDLEILVVDDGSSDETADIVAAHRDSRIRLLRQANAGAAAARNLALAKATGELVTFVDSDDVLFDEHVRALCDVLPPGEAAIATANAHYLGPAGLSGLRHRQAIPRPRHQRMALLQSNFLSPMSLFPRRLVDEIGVMDPDLARSEDWDFWLRAVYAGYRVVQQPRPTALFRRSQITMTSNRDLVREAEDLILRRMASRDDLSPDESAYLRRRLAVGAPSLHYEAADEAVSAGRYAEAARAYATAASLVPHERALVIKARGMRVAPRLVGPVLRRRGRATT